jgi:hypothetical protein
VKKMFRQIQSLFSSAVSSSSRNPPEVPSAPPSSVSSSDPDNVSYDVFSHRVLQSGHLFKITIRARPSRNQQTSQEIYQLMALFMEQIKSSAASFKVGTYDPVLTISFFPDGLDGASPKIFLLKASWLLLLTAEMFDEMMKVLKSSDDTIELQQIVFTLTDPLANRPQQKNPNGNYY